MEESVTLYCSQCSNTIIESSFYACHICHDDYIQCISCHIFALDSSSSQTTIHEHPLTIRKNAIPGTIPMVDIFSLFKTARKYNLYPPFKLTLRSSLLLLITILFHHKIGRILFQYNHSSSGHRLYLSDLALVRPGVKDFEKLDIRSVLSLFEPDATSTTNQSNTFTLPLVEVYKPLQHCHDGEQHQWFHLVTHKTTNSHDRTFLNIVVPDVTDPKFLPEPLQAMDILTMGTCYIDECLKVGNVLVHCEKGRRRSPTMVVAWLMTLGYGPNEALSYFHSNYQGEKEWLNKYKKSHGPWFDFLIENWSSHHCVQREEWIQCHPKNWPREDPLSLPMPLNAISMDRQISTENNSDTAEMVLSSTCSDGPKNNTPKGQLKNPNSLVFRLSRATTVEKELANEVQVEVASRLKRKRNSDLMTNKGKRAVIVEDKMVPRIWRGRM